jgi:hypothetical protein
MQQSRFAPTAPLSVIEPSEAERAQGSAKRRGSATMWPVAFLLLAIWSLIGIVAGFF